MVKKKAVYFVGIGGIGLSALARYFKMHGYTVAGSDFARSTITDTLKNEGISVTIGHKRSNINSKISFVVYSRAIFPANNPELLEGQRLGIPIVPYAKVLGELTKQYTTIAITGSHGKSTTTALAALALIRSGLDPTVLVGTNLREFGGKNIRVGKDSPITAAHRHNYLVLEADDYGAAFLEYSPTISIITNIDREHMDFYKTFDGVKNTFLKFIGKTRGDGILILNRDDKALYSLRARITAIAKKKHLRTIWYSTTKSPAGATKIKKSLKLPGKHNLSNATAVYELGKLLKIPEKKILTALGSYQGAWRRMEYRGKAEFDSQVGSAMIYDDYAHHPTEIRATLQAFREKFARQPIVCVFQPHQAKRLQILFKEFVSAFNDTDVLILIPFYKVAGRDEKESNITSERLAQAIAKKYPHKRPYYVAEPKNIKKSLNRIMLADGIKKPVIVMMGAGDIIKYTGSLLR
jgi:UDP-N-acetylmuramate--alanine ligase